MFLLFCPAPSKQQLCSSDRPTFVLWSPTRVKRYKEFMSEQISSSVVSGVSAERFVASSSRRHPSRREMMEGRPGGVRDEAVRAATIWTANVSEGSEGQNQRRPYVLLTERTDRKRAAACLSPARLQN